MPETEADRMVRAQAKQQKKQEKEAKQRQDRHDQETKQTLASQLESEIAAVLRLLAAHGYPDMITISLPKESGNPISWFLDLFATTPLMVQKAAWRLGVYQRLVSWGGPGGDRGYQPIDIYLLSDGRIFMDRHAVTPSLVDVEILQECLDGVNELRRRLEAL